MRKKHIHKYKRVNLGRDKKYHVLRCTLPHCTHYIDKELALNREALCAICEEKMIITRAALRNVRVHCLKCTRSKKRNEVERILELIETGMR